MKLPVAYSLGNREASLDKDALLRNCFAEVDEQAKVIRAIKRPSVVNAFTVTSGTGQALFVWNIPGPLAPTQTLVSIVGDTINTAPTAIPTSLTFSVQPS